MNHLLASFRYSQLYSLVAIVLWVLQVASGQNVSWDDGGVNKRWSTAFNWSPNGLPNSGNDVFIGNLPSATGDLTSIDTDFTIQDLVLSSGAAARTLGNRLTMNGLLDIQLASRFFLSEHSGGPSTRSLQLVGQLMVNNLAAFEMEGGYASVGGSVDVGLGGTFLGYGDFQFTNGLTSVQTVFTNNGSLSTGRESGSTADDRFVLRIRANDADARIDLDGVNNDRVVNVVQNTTLDLDIRARNFGGTMTMAAGAILDGNGDAWQTTSGSILQVDADTAATGVSDTAVIRNVTYNALNGSQINVNSGTLVFESAFQANSTSQLLVANGAGLQFDGTANIDGDLAAAGAYDLTVNGNLTINDATFDWDGLAPASTTTTINNGALLTIDVTTIDATGGYDGTIDIDRGTLDVDVASPFWEMGGTMNLRGDAVVRGAAGVFLTGDLVASAGGVPYISSAIQFQPGSTTHVEAGTDLFFLGLTTFKGSSTHTGSGNGEVSFGGNIVVDGDTTIDMPGGRVQLDSNSTNQTLTLNSDLTVNATSLLSAVGATGGGTFTINIPSSTSRLNVNLAGNNEWVLGSDGIMNITVAGTLSTSLAGSDTNVDGRINVNGSTRFTNRITLREGGLIDLQTGGTRLNLNGGSASDPNRLEGGFIDGIGTLQSFGTALEGYGQINTDISFAGGSDLIAEGGTLILLGEVLAADRIGATLGGTLSLGQPLDTANVGAVRLTGGTITTAAINNNGILEGFGLVSTSGLNNNGQIIALGGQTLTIDTVGAPDLDGSGESGQIIARLGSVSVVDAPSDSVGGTIEVGAGQFVEVQSNWTQQAGGSILLDGSPSVAARLRGSTVELNGSLTIDEIGRLDARTIFRPSSNINLPDATDVLQIHGGATVQPGATFSGSGMLVNRNGSTLTLIVGSTVDAEVVNEGAVTFLSNGSASVAQFEQSASGSIDFRIGGTALVDYQSLDVDGGAEFNGEISAQLTGGFAPELGDSFRLMTYGSFVGIFDTESFPALPSGLDWELQYSNNLILRVIEQIVATGDFDGNGLFNSVDIDLLYDEIFAGTDGPSFDLNGDGSVDNDDIGNWLSVAGIENGKTYLAGDANLDGSVGGDDFTALASNFGAAEINPSSGGYWGNGNFDGIDGSGLFSIGGSDFTSLASNFGHVSVAAVPAVPEPASSWLLLFGGLVYLGARNRHTMRV